MRTVVLVAAAVCVALGTAVPASAQSDPSDRSEDSQFPDLPGMGVAGRASRGEVADYEPGDSSSSGGGSPTASAGADGEPDAEDDGARGETAERGAPSSDSVRQLPGSAPVPLIGALKTRHTATAPAGMPRGLTALAALGTLLSVGAFLLARERVLGR